MKQLRLFLTTLIILTCTSAWAGTSALDDLKRMAQDGDADAQFSLGLMHATGGQGVEQNYSEAIKWIGMAADQGIAYAQDYLGTMYEEGRGVPSDMTRAADYYLKAADQGNASAQGNIGRLYAYGKGVPQNFVISYMWLSLSISGGNARMVPLREEVKKLIPPEYLPEAERLVHEWHPSGR